MCPIDEFCPDNVIHAHSLRLLYQPRISPQSMTMIGVHGCAQWRSEMQDWMDIAPTANLSINQFSRLWTWQLDQIESRFSALRHRDSPSLSRTSPFSISLTLSPKLLHSDEWAIQLLHAIEMADIPGSCLEVELMEHGCILNTLYVDWSFNAIRNAGVPLVLNNFPVGVASMSRLARYEFDKVIINKSVMPSPHDSEAVWAKKRELFEGLVFTIRHMGAEAVIDGIETAAHIQYLQRLPATEWRGNLWGGATEFDHIWSGASCASEKMSSNTTDVKFPQKSPDRVPHFSGDDGAYLL
jgi:EAL domain-containing protein (putative c-di-GMP-specific phosphodiesterase class I)